LQNNYAGYGMCILVEERNDLIHIKSLVIIAMPMYSTLA